MQYNRLHVRQEDCMNLDEQSLGTRINDLENVSDLHAFLYSALLADCDCDMTEK